MGRTVAVGELSILHPCNKSPTQVIEFVPNLWVYLPGPGGSDPTSALKFFKVVFTSSCDRELDAITCI